MNLLPVLASCSALCFVPTEAAGSVSFDDTDSEGVADAEPKTIEPAVADGGPNAGESLGRLYLTDWFYET